MSNLCRADFAASSVEHSLFPLLEETGQRPLPFYSLSALFYSADSRNSFFTNRGNAGRRQFGVMIVIESIRADIPTAIFVSSYQPERNRSNKNLRP